MVIKNKYIRAANLAICVNFSELEKTPFIVYLNTLFRFEKNKNILAKLNVIIIMQTIAEGFHLIISTVLNREGSNACLHL